MEFIVYGYETISGSDVGMRFTASFEQAKTEAAIYRAAFRQLDPTGEMLGAPAIHRMVLQMPDVPTIIDLLNSPECLVSICLKSRSVVTSPDEGCP